MAAFSWTDLKKIISILPPLLEQKKIAEIISGIDRLIDMSQIGDVLKMQKKNPKDFKKMINRIGKM